MDGENEKPVVPPETPGRVTEEKRPREANQKSKNKISGSKSKELSSKNKEDKKSKKSSKTLKEEKFEAIEEQEAEEEAGDAENEEEGEEEGEEEDDGSGEFDELSKVHVPLKMKKFVRWDSQKPSSQQNFSEEASSNSHVDSSKKKISIKTLTQLHKPAANDTNRGQIKRKTFSKKHLEETPSITKSELKRIKIRPLPKPKAVSNPKETSVKDPPVKNLSVVKEEPKQPKEDSFFKNFDASNLDFSKYKASQESWNKQKKDPKLLTTDSYPTFLDNEVL